MPAHRLPDKNFKWTRSLAYVIGLLATDGSLSKDGRHITIKSCDLQLIKTFKKCLSLSNKISVVKNNGFGHRVSYVIQFGNVQFYRWLLKIGLFPAKTYTINKINVPDKYFSDFLRGHLDGDGSIWTYKDRYNTFKNPKYIYVRLWTRFISVSENHIKWLQIKISELFGIKGHLWKQRIFQPHQTVAMWDLKFAKKDSLKLLSLIYHSPNVPCLKRKRKIADKFLKKYPYHFS